MIQVDLPTFPENFTPAPVGFFRADQAFIPSVAFLLGVATFTLGHKTLGREMGMGQYLLISFLMGWTSIYQLFWCSPGVQGFDTLPDGDPAGCQLVTQQTEESWFGHVAGQMLHHVLDHIVFRIFSVCFFCHPFRRCWFMLIQFWSIVKAVYANAGVASMEDNGVFTSYLSIYIYMCVCGVGQQRSIVLTCSMLCHWKFSCTWHRNVMLR